MKCLHKYILSLSLSLFLSLFLSFFLSLYLPLSLCFQTENCSSVYQGELCAGLCPSSLVSVVPGNVTTNLQLLFSILSIAGESCKAEDAVLKEFFCQFVYLPCNDNQPTLPSREVCRRLRDESCAYEWGQVSGNKEYSSLLPDCELLPEDPEEVNCSDSKQHLRSCTRVGQREREREREGEREIGYVLARIYSIR